MQSESSLVVVGSADDVLRVPKSRRKIENVTQSMVDTMVVDEVYDFIKKVLTNPPGPRTPTVINSAFYAKFNKINAGDKSSGVYQRKRKNESGDQDVTPAKSKQLSMCSIETNTSSFGYKKSLFFLCILHAFVSKHLINFLIIKNPKKYPRNPNSKILFKLKERVTFSLLTFVCCLFLQHKQLIGAQVLYEKYSQVLLTEFYTYNFDRSFA